MSGLDTFITNAEGHDLSNDDIKNITNGKCKVISYHELVSINKLDDLFVNNNACIILYETKQNFGHWTALIKQNDYQVEFFDPYGLDMDSELNIAKYNNTPYLTNLFNQTNYRLITNKTQLQHLVSQVNTCGRWCSMRVVMKNIPIGQFANLFTTNQHYNNDFWVSALTYIYTMK